MRWRRGNRFVGCGDRAYAHSCRCGALTLHAGSIESSVVPCYAFQGVRGMAFSGYGSVVVHASHVHWCTGVA